MTKRLGTVVHFISFSNLVLTMYRLTKRVTKRTGAKILEKSRGEDLRDEQLWGRLCDVTERGGNWKDGEFWIQRGDTICLDVRVHGLEAARALCRQLNGGAAKHSKKRAL